MCTFFFQSIVVYLMPPTVILYSKDEKLNSGRFELKQNLPNVFLPLEYFEFEDKTFYQNIGVVDWVVVSRA